MPFCDMCGKQVSADARFCPECGRRFPTATAPPSPPPSQAPPLTKPAITESKDPGVAALLAFLLGLGFFGIGHIYVGKLGKGLALLVISIVLNIMFAGAFVFGAVWLPFGLLGIGTAALGFWFMVGVVLLLARFALWIWQIYDAYKLAKQFNAHVQQYGKAPW